MTEKILGGHAIMLRCKIPSELVKVAIDWVNEKGDQRSLKLKCEKGDWFGHVTLVFCGRDKKPEVGEKMLEAARFLLERVRNWESVVTEYPDMYGYRCDHFAYAIEDEHSCLIKAYYDLKVFLRGAGVTIKDTYNYNPHVTLAIGEPQASLPAGPAMQEHWLQVEGLEVKIGSNRTEFLPL